MYFLKNCFIKQSSDRNLFYDKYHHVMFVYKKKYGKYEEMKIVLDELNLDQEDVIKRAFAGL